MQSGIMVAFVLKFCSSLVTAIPADWEYTPDGFTLLPSRVQTELGHQLSRHAVLYFPDSPDWTDVTERWSPITEADFAAVVIPAVAEDVAVTVRFADQYNVPFLAKNRGHGTAAGLEEVHHGISIYIRELNEISIAADGNSATMGGGVSVAQAINYLAKYGKTSASGICECISMLGPGLGGGFGRYQGFFGLVSDNLISLDVVIADGSQITVSTSQHPDLYWALRGAGHNFGIVTRFELRIYDEPVPSWFIATLIFTGDKLEAFFTLWNKVGDDGKQPKELVMYALFGMSPTISADPVIIFTFQYAGPLNAAAPILAPFNALQPASASNETVPYTGVAHAAQTGLTDATCQPGRNILLFPVGLLTYNIDTNRQIYELFKDMVTKHPGLNESIVQFEGYSLEAVKAVPADSSAYPHREDNLLVSYDPTWTNPSLEDVAKSYGRRARRILHDGDADGRPLNTYVNYASTDESLEMLYGHEPWRLERLRRLKREYDPLGRFDFYWGIWREEGD